MNYKVSLTVLALLLIFALTGMAQQPQQKATLEDPPWIKENAPPRIVYSVPGTEQIKARKDITYKSHARHIFAPLCPRQ